MHTIAYFRQKLLSMLQSVRESFSEAQRVLDEFVNNHTNWEKFEKAGNLMIHTLRQGGKILTCGNGGSMSDAMHFAEELSGRFREDRPALAAIAIADPTHITCVANDYGFDYVFSRYVEAVGKSGDVLLAISTSGNSANVVKAAEAAKARQMNVVALTGKTGGILAGMADVELRAPFTVYSDRVQEIHIKIIHTLIQYIEDGLRS